MSKTQHKRSKTVTVAELRHLRPYKDWSERRLRAEAERLNAKRGARTPADGATLHGETRQEFIERMLPDCHVAEAPARVGLGELFDALRHHQAALKAGSSRQAHEAGQDVARFMAMVGLDHKTETKDERERYISEVIASYQNYQRAQARMVGDAKQEAILAVRSGMRRQDVEEYAARAAMTYQEAREAAGLDPNASPEVPG